MRYLGIPLLTLMLVPWIANAGESASRQVRKLFLKRDEIVQVRTSIGIATIIQVPDRPTSVVLGDTNAFKVEYLDTAVTIKPLNHSSKSNLYIYTEGRRFNVSLVTTPQAGADYIVYLNAERPPLAAPKVQWRKFEAEKSNGSLKLIVRKLGVVGSNLVVDFSLTAKKDVSFGPEWIWVTQNGKTIPINGLNLSGTKLTPKAEINGGLVIRKEDVSSPTSLTFELRTGSPISIKLPGVASWRK